MKNNLILYGLLTIGVLLAIIGYKDKKLDKLIEKHQKEKKKVEIMKQVAKNAAERVEIEAQEQKENTGENWRDKI